MNPLPISDIYDEFSYSTDRVRAYVKLSSFLSPVNERTVVQSDADFLSHFEALLSADCYYLRLEYHRIRLFGALSLDVTSFFELYEMAQAVGVEEASSTPYYQVLQMSKGKRDMSVNPHFSYHVVGGSSPGCGIRPFVE